MSPTIGKEATVLQEKKDTQKNKLIEDVNYVDGKLNGLAKYFDIKGVIKVENFFPGFEIHAADARAHC